MVGSEIDRSPFVFAFPFPFPLVPRSLLTVALLCPYHISWFCFVFFCFAPPRQAIEDLAFCGFRMYDENRQPWGSAEEYFDQKIKMKDLSGGQRHLMFVRSFGIGIGIGTVD